jgi:hypothetical protein
VNCCAPSGGASSLCCLTQFPCTLVDRWSRPVLDRHGRSWVDSRFNRRTA